MIIGIHCTKPVCNLVIAGCLYTVYVHLANVSEDMKRDCTFDWHHANILLLFSNY